ncbi:MAG: UDP-N-acetylglucosamine 1-carboxyvinyltransferase [Chrysiogenetes bacterium]|nr:UDP-N-acetylglucosamine 1-carboxyvinyltransferase [Chrysiogenetes bacterium]
MDKFVIEGGTRLEGTVQVSGAKNAVLPLMTCALLSEGVSEIDRVPNLRDVRTMLKLIERLGASTTFAGNSATINAAAIKEFEAPYDLVKTMRASVLALGPLVARFGRARISLPGGCAIGARPIDQHLKGLEALGAEIVLEHGYVEARARRLKGATFTFDVKSVTGTENLIMAAALAKGETVFHNAACEPEVVQIADALNQMGASVEGAGTDTIRVKGADSLVPFKLDVIPDRIEAGTLLVAGAIAGGPVRVEGVVYDHVDTVVEKLIEAGAKVKIEDDAITVSAKGRLKGVDIRTKPFPGFATDMQAQFMALLALAEGSSVFSETVFENRYMHAQELQRLGANISVEGRTAVVKGVKKLSGAPVMATDLRASACLVLAGLVAEGTTEVLRIYHLDRGYERLEEKLGRLGARIQRLPMEGV